MLWCATAPASMCQKHLFSVSVVLIWHMHRCVAAPQSTCQKLVCCSTPKDMPEFLILSTCTPQPLIFAPHAHAPSQTGIGIAPLLEQAR